MKKHKKLSRGALATPSNRVLIGRNAMLLGEENRSIKKQKLHLLLLGKTQPPFSSAHLPFPGRLGMGRLRVVAFFKQ
jgi:hypothetical protein